MLELQRNPSPTSSAAYKWQDSVLRNVNHLHSSFENSCFLMEIFPEYKSPRRTTVLYSGSPCRVRFSRSPWSIRSGTSKIKFFVLRINKYNRYDHRTVTFTRNCSLKPYLGHRKCGKFVEILTEFTLRSSGTRLPLQAERHE